MVTTYNGFIIQGLFTITIIITCWSSRTCYFIMGFLYGSRLKLSPTKVTGHHILYLRYIMCVNLLSRVLSPLHLNFWDKIPN